ncbi:protease inhibitor I42 family protein [Chloroflexota bacterium]
MNLTTLCSNPSTGFYWNEKATINDSSILRQESHKYVPPSDNTSEPLLPWTPGREEWRFQPIHQGIVNISMRYTRVWEDAEEEEWTYALKLIVK